MPKGQPQNSAATVAPGVEIMLTVPPAKSRQSNREGRLGTIGSGAEPSTTAAAGAGGEAPPVVSQENAVAAERLYVAATGRPRVGGVARSHLDRARRLVARHAQAVERA